MPADVFENRFDCAIRGCKRGGMQAACGEKPALTLAEQSREIDPLTLKDDLAKKGLLEQVGGTYTPK